MSNLLPDAERAQIDPRKLRDYALNPEHESGRFKAAFFSQMGYTAADWRQLELDIRNQILGRPAASGRPSGFGTKYIITATLRGPNEATRQVTTVWLIRNERDFAELITIEPAARQRRA